VDAAGGQTGIGEVVGENVGVGVNHTEQIVDGVGNDFGARRRMGGVFAEVETEIGVLWNGRLSFSFGDEGTDGVVHGLGGEIVKGKATGCAGAQSLGSEIGEILSGRIEEGEDGKDGKLRAKFLDGVEGLKIGSVKIEGQGITRAGRKGMAGVIERISALNGERNQRRLSKGSSDFQPGGIFPQEETTERLSEHRSS
jgi:hypothetical protein